jgi:preprotein translocase SecF subunit
VKGVEVRANQDENTFEVVMPGVSQAVQESIAGALDGQKFQVLSVDSVGPKVGASLQQAAVISIFATLGLVLLYVAFRFDLSFAPGAVIALFHDVIITMGIFVLLQREINVSFIGALLTIIGYSLNDTIVIYDRIRENMQRYRRSDLAGLINDSVNDTLGRTLSTAFTTLLAISAFLFMGGPVIENFALAMLIGIVVGAYSTVYVASPFILIMESVKPSLQRLFTPAATGVSTDSVGGGAP